MYREIAAKTLTAKGKLSYFNELIFNLDENVSKLLGCWIIDLKQDTYVINKTVHLKGTYSIQLWYAIDNDKKSSVFENRLDFDEVVNMSYRDYETLSDDMFLKVFISKYPTCLGMELNENNEIVLKIEGEFYIDAFQEAILYVMCSDKKIDDLSLDEEILMNVNPNYLVNKK